MVRTADFRASALDLLRHNSRGMPYIAAGMLIEEAVNLDHALEAWANSLPQEWLYNVYTLSRISPEHEVFQDGVGYSFATWGHTAVWARYQAVHLLVTSLHIQLRSSLEPETHHMPSFSANIEPYRKRIAFLATDLCRTT